MKFTSTTVRSLMLVLISSLLLSTSVFAREYLIDTKGMHASIQFRIKHLGFSWLTGRFEKFEGRFNYDKRQPENSNIDITVQTASVTTNHAERDKRLRNKKYLDVKTWPQARFVSQSFTPVEKDQFILKGNLSLHGVTRPIEMLIRHIGKGHDPWGKFRRGFEGRFEITLADYGMTSFLGKDARTMEIIVNLEGIRQ